jgi:hypothetical protein
MGKTNREIENIFRSHKSNKVVAIEDHLNHALEHENYMISLTHKQCHKCKSVSIVKDHRVIDEYRNIFECFECHGKKDTYFVNPSGNGLLPVWFVDHNVVHYEQPEELKDLRLGEMLLIQKLACYIPIVHIRNGVMGLQGHCVCFRQDLSNLASELPRKNVTAIKVVRSCVNKMGEETFHTFTIRKQKVLEALKWLKKHHRWYRDDPDLVINESNLDWMNGEEEAELTDIEIIEDNNDVFYGNGVVSDANVSSLVEGQKGMLDMT